MENSGFKFKCAKWEYIRISSSGGMLQWLAQLASAACSDLEEVRCVQRL